MTVVEIGLMGVKPDHDVINPTTPEGRVLDSAWTYVTTAPGGPYWAYGGIDIDDKLRLWGFFPFDSIAHHAEFAKVGGAEATKDLPKILSHPIFMGHVQLDEDLRDVLNAPVAEVTLLYFPPNISDADKDSVSKAFSSVIQGGLDSNTDMRAVRAGWSVEKDWPVLESREKSQETATVFGIFVGWSSAEAQKKARGIQGVLDNQEELKASLDGKVLHSATRLVECRQFGTARV